MAVDPFTLAMIGSSLMGLFGAKQSSNAAQSASREQADAANRAAELMAQTQRESIGLQRDIYNQGRADQAPWIRAGQGSVNKLAHLMGIGGMGGGGGFTPLSAPGGSAGRTRLTPDQRREARYGGNPFTLGGGDLTPRQARQYGAPAAAMRTPGVFSDAADDGSGLMENDPRRPSTWGRPGRRPQGQVVMMTAPDGSAQAVPSDQVDHYLSLGATVAEGS